MSCNAVGFKMRHYIVVVIAIGFVLFVKYHHSNYVVDKVRADNYTIEVHSNVITKDGYILTLHRIPHGKDGMGTEKRQPVYMMHSLFSASDNFVFLEPNKSLAYILADRGYDVWMGNVRATSYCRKHIKLNPDTDKEFWNFTLTEMADNDITASIDYILKTTNSKQLQYVGYSQGATLFIMAASLHPEYMEKVNLFIGLSPAVYLEHMKHPFFKHVKDYIDDMIWWSSLFGAYDLHPGRDLVRAFGPPMCGLPGIGYICQFIIGKVAGSNPAQFKSNHMINLISNAPEGTGLWQFAHLMQLAGNSTLRKFDYGREENNLRYGSDYPPEFSVNTLNVPTALYYAENDLLVPKEGVEKLAKTLPNVIELHKVEDINFTHLDFVIADDVATLVNNRVLDVMDKYKT